MTATTLTPALREMLARVARASDGLGAFVTLPTTATRREASQLARLVRSQLVELCGHPSIWLAGDAPAPDVPAPAVRITEAGRAALAKTQGSANDRRSDLRVQLH